MDIPFLLRPHILDILLDVLNEYYIIWEASLYSELLKVAHLNVDFNEPSPQSPI